MSSIALNLYSRPASVPVEEPDTLPTQSAAEATGPATTTPREPGPTPAGDGSIQSAVSNMASLYALHRVASGSDGFAAGSLTLRSETMKKQRADAAEPAQGTGDSNGKPPARAVNLPAAVGTADGFKRGNK